MLTIASKEQSLHPWIPPKVNTTPGSEKVFPLPCLVGSQFINCGVLASAGPLRARRPLLAGEQKSLSLIKEG